MNKRYTLKFGALTWLVVVHNLSLPKLKAKRRFVDLRATYRDHQVFYYRAASIFTCSFQTVLHVRSFVLPVYPASQPVHLHLITRLTTRREVVSLRPMRACHLTNTNTTTNITQHVHHGATTPYTVRRCRSLRWWRATTGFPATELFRFRNRTCSGVTVPVTGQAAGSGFG
jgi:hypothetical protein